MASVFTLLVAMLSVIVQFQRTLITEAPNAYGYIMDVNKPLAVIVAVSLFMFFKNMKPFYNSLINIVASSTFGVLLIHANSDLMRYWLWRDTLQNVIVYYTGNTYIHAITSILSIYIICTIFDQIRINFIEKPFFKKATIYINKAEKLIESKLFS